ncbi:hypothetical protein KC992_02735 [Candidatus Saccharibacteria bacterium]|nr:hypothetical protein [Candidatus Saccharibacteria bacterium]
MKRLFVLSLCLVLIAQLFPSMGPNKAKAANEGVWEGAVTLTSGDALTAEEVGGRPDCSFRDVYVKKYAQPLDSIVQVFSFGHYTLENIGRKCVLGNQQGYFTKTTYRASEASAMYELENFGSATQWLDPAPGGDAVLHITKSQANDKVYRLSLERDYAQVSSAVISGINVKWRYNSIPTIFVDKNNTPVVFAAHAFSANGRYLAVRFNNGVVAKVDLETREMTAVTYYPSWANNAELAVSSDGRYVGVKNNELVVFDVSGCQNIYPYPTWELSQLASVPGCTKSANFQTQVTAAVSNNPSAVLLQQLNFSLDSSTLLIGGGLRRPDAPPAQAGFAPYDWVQYALKPDAWQSTAAGYLAMGDSFSSGEGDNKGGIWYEPGTDEQGDSSTFVGRNLCHLSRRSYPYLIAKDLGLLNGTLAEPTSPTSDSLFHSVACSGAVMHNILGTDKGLKKEQGEEDTFRDRDNQYIFDYLGSLDAWQPGHVRQLDFLNSENEAGYGNAEQKPAIITLGISGNDAGFGDTLQACAASIGTCPQAVQGSLESDQLVFGIAALKGRLVETYTSVKRSSPESRVYVHGYPIFVTAGGNCGANVHLNNEETFMVQHGVTYMNEVVKAAAREAGVVYVDVTHILDGVNLCSGASEPEMAVNGVTAGNDVGLPWYIDLLTLGVCSVRDQCLGKESYHPNAKGHERYKQAALDQTAQLTAPNPTAQPTNYPLPDSVYYSPRIHDIIESFNGEQPASVPLPQYESIVSLQSNQLHYAAEGFYPGSTVTIEVHSDPQQIGEVTATQDGSITGVLSLPTGLEAGVHSLHLVGIDAYGQKADKYQTFVAGVAQGDFDGDSVADDVDSCISVPNSGIDADGDSVDDACDSDVVPIVDQPPPPDDDTPHAACKKHPRPVCEFLKWRHRLEHRRHSGFSFWARLFWSFRRG